MLLSVPASSVLYREGFSPTTAASQQEMLPWCPGCLAPYLGAGISVTLCPGGQASSTAPALPSDESSGGCDGRVRNHQHSCRLPGASTWELPLHGWPREESRASPLFSTCQGPTPNHTPMGIPFHILKTAPARRTYCPHFTDE